MQFFGCFGSIEFSMQATKEKTIAALKNQSCGNCLYFELVHEEENEEFYYFYCEKKMQEVHTTRWCTKWSKD